MDRTLCSAGGYIRIRTIHGGRTMTCIHADAGVAAGREGITFVCNQCVGQQEFEDDDD